MPVRTKTHAEVASVVAKAIPRFLSRESADDRIRMREELMRLQEGLRKARELDPDKLRIPMNR